MSFSSTFISSCPPQPNHSPQPSASEYSVEPIPLFHPILAPLRGTTQQPSPAQTIPFQN
ncbi:hypothetical protein BDY21DRAFT_337950 [Lineolata rhizophorae]|uniref:Uncharacterized protein n=1 Tax=Lineolata rhizophorae TaxID=578093 RepID=A0A6A6P665_9PEZI|nr:hypothetical protein BDY21DRAFT_337950 [Lineolata rhizophorae]